MKIPRWDGVALTRALVRCDSRNPRLTSDAVAGEGPIAALLRGALLEWGVRDVSIQDIGAGRANVIARVPGSDSGTARSLMFNGHLDTVDVVGMTHAPFEAHTERGRIYGRGASDMKGGVAAMCAAAARLQGRLKGDLIVAAVADEEWESHGTRALIRAGVRADAAIVTEPTRLRVMPAHKGFVWHEIEVTGRAAHGSRWDLGVDAIRGAGLVLVELDRLDGEELPRRSHPLLGRPSLHAAVIDGGVGLSTYPERCMLTLERRTLPGERDADVHAEIAQACARVRESRGEFGIVARQLFSQPPSDVAVDAPIVRSLVRVVEGCGLPGHLEGMSAWTDAALLNDAGIPAICFGPGDMGLAHAAEEFIEMSEIEQATEALVALALEWCN